MKNGILDSGQKIITNGLVLNYDVAQLRSYPKIGTNITDLSGNGNNGTLINGVGFNALNGGNLLFDGINDYVNCGVVSSLGSDPSLPFSFSIWVKKNVNKLVGVFEKYAGSTVGGIFGWTVRLDQPATNDVFLYLNKSQVGGTSIIAENVLSLNTWVNITVTYNGSFGYLYINGIFKSSGATPGGVVSTRNIYFGIISQSTNALNGNIGNALGYTKTLSATEVLQNFNANRSRYGL